MPNKIEKRENEYFAQGELGEQFTGATPEEWAGKILDSQQNTKRWGQQEKAAKEAALARAEALEQENARLKGAHPPQPSDPNLEDYIATTGLPGIARKLGIKGGVEELASTWQRLNKLEEKAALIDIGNQFRMARPDYPDTPEALKVMEDAWNAMGGADRSPTLNDMKALYDDNVRAGSITPLTMDERNQAAIDESTGRNRPTPPPIPRSGNPEQQRQDVNPWTMKLDDLRQAAIRQQLEGKG